MLGRVTKYNIGNDAPFEVFEADSEQDRKVSILAIGPSLKSLSMMRMLCLTSVLSNVHD